MFLENKLPSFVFAMILVILGGIAGDIYSIFRGLLEEIEGTKKNVKKKKKIRVLIQNVHCISDTVYLRCLTIIRLTIIKA